MNSTYFPVHGAHGLPFERAPASRPRWIVWCDDGGLLEADEAWLANVSVDMKFGYLVLRAPGMLRLDIPIEVEEDDPTVIQTILLNGVSVSAADEGPWAAAWFSELAGRPVRLLKLCSPAA